MSAVTCLVMPRSRRARGLRTSRITGLVRVEREGVPGCCSLVVVQFCVFLAVYGFIWWVSNPRDILQVRIWSIQCPFIYLRNI